MAKAEKPSDSPITAVQAIFDALEPLDDDARRRVIASALSLLGMSKIQTPVVGALLGMSEIPAPVGAPRGVVQMQAESRSRELLRPMSLVELIQEKEPASNVQKIALFAYYRERYEGQNRFSRADLKNYYSVAKERPPANFDRDFTRTVKQGWIHEDGDDSYLTSKGLEAVEAGFAGKALPRGTSARRKPKSKKTQKKSKRRSSS